MKTGKTAVAIMLAMIMISIAGCSGTTVPAKADSTSAGSDTAGHTEPVDSTDAVNETEVIKLCSEYVTAIYGTELQGKANSLDAILSKGQIGDYVNAKMGLLADRRYEASNSLENVIITCAVTEMKKSGGDIFVVMAVTLSYQNNGVGYPIQRSDDFHFRLTGEGEELRIIDVFNRDSIDVACRGITGQSTMSDSGITDAHVVAVEGYFDALKLPTREEILSMSEYDQLIALGEQAAEPEGAEKVAQLHMQSLSSSEFLLLVAQASHKMDNDELDQHAFILFLRNMYDKLIPTMRESDFADIILSEDYGDYFKWFMMDFYNIYSEQKGANGYGMPQNSELYDAALAQLAADATQRVYMRIDAASKMSTTSSKKEILLVLFNELSGEDKTHVHQILNREFPETILEMATA